MAKLMEHLGKLRQLGECFLHTTKPQIRWERKRYAPYHKKDETPSVVVLKRGFRGFFTKGKRRYYGEVLELVETRTGRHAYDYGPFHPDRPLESISRQKGPRWYQFTYLIRIIEN